MDGSGVSKAVRRQVIAGVVQRDRDFFSAASNSHHGWSKPWSLKVQSPLTNAIDFRQDGVVAPEQRLPVLKHVRFALEPEPAPVLLRVGIAVLLDMVILFAALKSLLLATGYPPEHVTHAVLPALFGGLFGFLGSLGGSTRSGLLRALMLSALALPLTLIAIVVRDNPVGAGLTLAAAAAFAGFLAWYGEPLATLGSLLLYMYFVPLAFGAGRGVPLKDLLLTFGVMIVLSVILRALVALVGKHRAPARVKATDEKSAAETSPDRGSTRRFTQVAQPQLSRLHRTTLRSAIGLGLGAFVMSLTGDHNAVWVLMTLIALVPPALPLTIDRVLQRLAGTVVAMVVLTVIAAVIPPGPLRLLALAPGIVVMIAFMRRSYTLSVLGVSLVAVLGYAQVSMPLQEALLWRGLDTLVGAAIAIVITLLIPVGAKPKPVWAHNSQADASS